MGEFKDELKTVWTQQNDVLTLVGWRGWTAEGSVWPVAVMGGSGLDLELELERLKTKTIICHQILYLQKKKKIE